jgi:hypothetical protein
MSNDNKDKPFNLSPHEKKISELYQNNKQHQGEEPSAQLDSEVMAMAKQQLTVNHSLLTKQQILNEQPHSDKGTHSKIKKSWQGPLSLVASVGLVSVLMITQKDYFIHPNNIVAGDIDILNEPVLRTPTVSATDTRTDELAVKPSFQSMKIVVSSQKHEVLLDSGSNLMARKKMSVGQTPTVLKEQILDKSMFEDKTARTSSMSLSELSKLAELLRIELATQNMSEIEASASIIKMQQSLFAQLAQYQKSHVDFIITEKYLNVLTDNQVQQLKPNAKKAVSEN